MGECVGENLMPGLADMHMQCQFSSIFVSAILLTGCVSHAPPPLELKRPYFQMAQHKPARKAHDARAQVTSPAELQRQAIHEDGDVSARRLPFSKEWYEREDEIDQRLRRIMIICRGC